MAVVAAAVLAAVVASLVTVTVAHRRLSRSITTRLGGLAVADGATASTDSIDDVVTRLDRRIRALVAARDACAAETDRLHVALDGVTFAVMLFDSSGDLVHSNAAAAPFLQARHGDALVGAAVLELVADAAADGSSRRTVDLFGPPRRIVEVTATCLGDGCGVVATVEDISERRHLEDVRTDLVANISHELKTPVGAMGLLAEALEGETDPATVERLVIRIQGEAMRLASIIDDLLDLSRIEAMSEVGDGDVDLGAVIAEVVDRLRHVAERSGVSLVVEPIARPMLVSGDRVQLVSAVANLVDNAIKYSDQGSQVDIGVRAAAGEATLVVRDRGMGIPTRDLDRIFERFYRVDQARSRDTGGSGLGLAIVRHVVANHGGRLSVTSRLGEGSTFTVVLPLAGPRPGASTNGTSTNGSSATRISERA